MRKTITKEFNWDCAHRLWTPAKTEEENKDIFGLCSNIHGHTYKMFVTISSQKQQKNGMIMNFKNLKQIVKKRVVDEQDHCLNLTHGDPLIHTLADSNLKISLWPDETTCENQVEYFWNQIEQNIPLGIRIEEIKLYETPTSFATLTR